MFDIGWSEMLVIAAVAVVVIGPKDLPRVMRTVGQFTTRVRGMAREFQNSMDEMARQADIDDMRRQMAQVQSDVSTSVNSVLDPGLASGATRPDYLPTPDDLMKDLAVNGPPPVVQPGTAAVQATPAEATPAVAQPEAPAVIPADGDAVAAAAEPAGEAPARRAEG